MAMIRSRIIQAILGSVTLLRRMVLTDKIWQHPSADLGAPGSCDSFWAYVNTVLYEGGEYKMWYSGFDGVQGLRIGYATSSDGVNWTKYAGNPVITNGSSGVWDAVHVQNPRVSSQWLHL